MRRRSSVRRLQIQRRYAVNSTALRDGNVPLAALRPRVGRSLPTRIVWVMLLPKKKHGTRTNPRIKAEFNILTLADFHITPAMSTVAQSWEIASAKHRRDYRKGRNFLRSMLAGTAEVNQMNLFLPISNGTSSASSTSTKP